MSLKEERSIAVTTAKRTSIDIMEAMLENIPANGIRKTHLANAALMDYKIMEKYLNILLNEKMIIMKDGKIYATKKGIEFLKEVRKLKQLMSK